MELTRFGLHRLPFRPTPDTSLYHPTDSHEAAFAAVTRAFGGGGGVAVVDGEPGTGKTLVGLKFLESLPADAQRVILHVPPGVTPADFFQAILFDLGLPYQGFSEQELRLAVHGEMLAALAAERPVVLLADEAHNLTPRVLEDIRLFGNLESRESKAVFVVLLGFPEVHDPLSRSAAGFAGRVAARSRLRPLDRDESIQFVRHQLRACGGRPERLIGDEALSLLAEHCRGIPRVLNRAAALAFDLAEANGSSEVDAEAVLEAAAQLELVSDEAASGDLPAVLALPVVRAETTEPKAAGKPTARKTKRKSA